MQVATKEAKRLAALSADSVVLNLFLSEAPIGDEYGCLTKEEWDRASRWEVIIQKNLGVQVWEELSKWK